MPRDDSATRPATGTTPVVQLVRSPLRRWLALALLMLPVLLVSIDNNVLTFAIPSITSSLGANGTQVLWMIDIYPLILAGFLVPMGNLGDRIGRRRVLLIGAVGFAAVSVAAAYSPTAETLILWRALQAVFGSMLMPATLSLIRNIFVDARERTMAVAVWASMFSAGAALGPIVGGWLLEHFWWGSVFLISVPILLPLLALSHVLIPESKDPKPGPMDPISIVLIVGSLLPITFGIKAASTGEPWFVSVAAIAIGALLGFLFVRRQLARDKPMLDVRLFQRKQFSGPLLVNMLSLFSLVGFMYFLAQHLQLVAGLSPADAATFMLPGLVVMFASGLAVVPFARRFGRVQLMVTGVLVNVAAYGLLALLGHTGELWAVMASFVLLGLGVGFSETVSNDLALSAVPAAKAGAASAISETAYEVGSVMGTAVLGGLLNAFFAGHLRVPAGLSAEQASTAGETLAGAHDVAGQLGGDTGSELLASAAHAFDTGVGLTAGIAAVLALVVAIVVGRLLRGVR
ncbi:MFS transporter [Galactobacter valiniphilus]|uniref:MFS transporter n=1 Tax=Galactobacter valiniphilus TaxID=2676122 RepID=A0A399JF89_9MICC|nr:MFS transporter [Galactobacter valiniphilus]